MFWFITLQLVLFFIGFLSSIGFVVTAAATSNEHQHTQTLLPQECLEFTPPGSIWRYRYCHMDHIEQFMAGASAFQKSNAKQPTRHVLGKWSATAPSAQTRVGDSLVFTYLGGDNCEVTGSSRLTMARLSCSGTCGLKHSVPHISGVSEPTVCVYVIDVCAPAMCSSITTNKRLDTHHPPSAADKKSRRFKMPEEEKKNILEKIKSIFYHSYEAYLKNAFPYDELRPLSCVGTNTDLTPGGMLTLIDALDTLATMGNVTEFQRVVRLLSKSEKRFFEIDSKVSVFETTIRILGGLLSAHLLVVDPELNFNFPEYDGALLRMAQDLGGRLLPAFDTSTTVPYGTIHLIRGVPYGETTEACTAAAGSLSLEFGMLSVLTGDPKYGKAARSALKSIFDLRSNKNLIGRHLDVRTGQWTEAVAGIGSNIDSIYEYYLKQYILFGDNESFEWFQILYEGAIRHLRLPEAGGRFYQEVDMKSGQVVRRYFSALQAFWPGVQVLAGDVMAATKSLNGFMAVWEFTDFLPEDFDLVRWTTVRGGSHSSYLLRPELAESVFYAYRATKDDSWLAAGKDMIDSVYQNCFVPQCGFAAIKDVDTKQQMDMMPSFFLSEWVKYVFLLFDESNFLNKGNWIFTTEAHPFRVTNWTQKNDFAASSFAYRSKAERRKKFSRTDHIADIPSIEDEEDVCQDLKSFPPEPYYKAPGASNLNQQNLRPFDKQDINPAADESGHGEKKVAGYLPDVGMFEIVSTTSSFSVHKVDTNNRIVISNLDATTGMATINDGRNPIFFELQQLNQVSFGSSCHLEILVHDMCPTFSLLSNVKTNSNASKAVAYHGPCSVGDGFGNPSWPQFRSLSNNKNEQNEFPVVFFPSATHLCDSEMSNIEPANLTKGTFYAQASRGECSFEEKAQNAFAQGAKGLIVTLVEAKDEPFIMAHAWNGSRDSFRPSVTSFLSKLVVAQKLSSLRNRPGANPTVRVELRKDTRVLADHGRVVITAFPGWRAVFGPQDENGLFRLSLNRA